MNEIVKLTKICLRFTVIHWQNFSNYRLANMVWIINGFITPLTLTVIWLVIQSTKELPLNDNQIITYFLLVTLMVRLTQSWTARDLGGKIRDGGIATHLLNPMPYWIPYLGKDLALKLLRIISLVPFFICFIIFFGDRLEVNLNLTSLSLFTLSVVIGFVLSFTMDNLIGLSAIFLDHVDGAHTIYTTMTSLFSGLLIPLSLMPSNIVNLSNALPFRFLISFPIQILVLQNKAELISGFVLSLIWLIGLIGAWVGLYRFSIKKFTAVGN